MTDQDKTREQLLDELVELRQRVATLEASERRYGTIIDTETERELAKHRVMLQTTIDCLPYNFFAIGVDGRYMLQNAVSKAQQGADVVGRRPEEVCSNEHDLAIWLENNRRAFAGEKVEGEVTLSLAGEERFYYNVIVPISDGTELYGILGVNIDITERKRAEEALQKAHDELEQRVKERTAELTKANDELRLIYDQMADGIVVVDVETTKPVRANAALCRMLGYSEEEIRTVTALQVHPPEAMPKIQEFFQAVVAGRVARFDNMPFLRRDGGVLLADVVSIRILYDGRPCRISFHHDVTDRKRAEEALRRSEERFRSYFEQGLLGMAVSSVEMQWIQVNDRLCSMLGYSRDELLGMKWTDITHPDDLDGNLVPQNRLLAGEIDYYTHGKRFVRKDGGLVHATVFARCFRRSDGAVDHVLALIEDVTERKRAQEALERERQSLWKMLQASDHERQTISYEIHDGLAQYLAAAGMQLQVFDGLRESKPEEAKKAYDAAMQLVRQSHAEARRLVSEVRPPIIDEIGLETAISHLVHEQRRQGGPEIECHSNVQFGRLPSILENALYRIVQEALTNACKHSKSKKVTVAMAQEGQDVRLEVRDWGIGFDSKSVEKGHFGLEGIRQRARLLGGRLMIESTPDSGTLVQVVVPIPIVERQAEE